jgi:hypothetical protein
MHKTKQTNFDIQWKQTNQIKKTDKEPSLRKFKGNPYGQTPSFV